MKIRWVAKPDSTKNEVNVNRLCQLSSTSCLILREVTISLLGLFWSVFSLIPTEYGGGVSLRIQPECWKIRTRTTPNADTFYAVYVISQIIYLMALIWLSVECTWENPLESFQQISSFWKTSRICNIVMQTNYYLIFSLYLKARKSSKGLFIWK